MRAPPRPTFFLQRLLKQEQENGFRNRSGLDNYLRRELDGDQQQLFKRIVAQLPQAGYAALTPLERQRWAQQVQEILQPGSKPSRSPTKQLNPPPPEAKDSKPAPKRSSSAKRRPTPSFAEDDPLSRPVSVLGTIFADSRKGLARLGLETVYDLLWHLPFRYEDWRNVRRIGDVFEDEDVTVVGEIQSIELRHLRGGRKATEAVVSDGTGTIRVWWWQQQWLNRALRPGMRVGLSGRVGVRGRRLQLESPEWERLDDPDDDTVHIGRLSPVYPRTKGLHNRTIRRLTHAAVREYLPLMAESLPLEIREAQRYPSEVDALRMLHFPDHMEEVAQARERIAFQELLTIQLAVLSRKREAQRRADAPPIAMPGEFLDAFLAALPFQLTNAQQRALQEVRADMGRREPMVRLLQGDVGSGKTVVAAAAMLAAVRAGYQTVLMAPTEVLAHQHFDTFQRLFSGGEPAAHQLWHNNYSLAPALEGRPLRMALLSGGVRAARKRQIHQEMESGLLDLVVGTHALIQDRARFQQLGLAVVDEQHRFGVLQRDSLRSQEGKQEGKASNPHLLVMTATPIPRTLALTVYGELDSSVIDELPPGRQRVETAIVAPEDRERIVYQRIREEVRRGRQAMVICPLVEESDKLEAEAATEQFDFLRSGPLREIAERIRLLHGRMSAAEKQQVMADLTSGAAQVLVSTIVVEVGVDLPNATVMAIEGAERFGLAQLHQLRGRVGRSDLPSVCFLIPNGGDEEHPRRLEMMVEKANGFELAEADLELRGAGEYFGTRQSGMPDLRVATLTDRILLNQARQWANIILDNDPHLRAPEHHRLAAAAGERDVQGATAQH